MSVHHSTKAKAEKKGILIEDAPEGSDFHYRAFWPERALEFWADDAKKLVDITIYCRMMMLEYNGLKYEQDGAAVEISFGKRKIGTVASLDDVEDATNDALEDLTEEEGAEVLAADAAEAAEEEERRGTVVPPYYKRKYAEEGHPDNCGDWLAFTLEPLVTGQTGKYNPDAMTDIATANGLSLDKLNVTSPGWQGRHRMTARNMLVKKIVAAGKLLVPQIEGDPLDLTPPAEWLAANQPKVKEPGDKKAARATKGV